MTKLATLLRYAQLSAHIGHNLITGRSFLPDHEFLGELYAAYEGAYDSVVERTVGLGKEIDLVEVNQEAADRLDDDNNSTNAGAIFTLLLEVEKEIASVVEEERKGASIGTDNLLAGLADESEVRQYKLKQRLAA